MVLGAGRRWMRDETGLALKTVVVVGGWPKAMRAPHRERLAACRDVSNDKAGTAG